MHVIYKVTYIPHLNTHNPKYYIGSKYNYKGKYYGSVSSKRVFEFTNNKTLKVWWKDEIIKNKDNFLFDILESYSDISVEKLVEREQELQIEFKCEHNDYFNQCYANKKFFSKPNTSETKKLKSEKTKAYWDTPEGMIKRQRLSVRNSLTKSEELSRKWKEDHEFRKNNTERMKAPKSHETKRKMSEARLSKNEPIEYKGKMYSGWGPLKNATGITKTLYTKYYLLGYDPEININNNHPLKIPL